MNDQPIVEWPPAQIQLASEWEAMEAGFGRDGQEAHDRLRSIVESLRRRHWLGVAIEAAGGMENFAHVFLYDAPLFPKHEEDGQVETVRHEGVSIYLSLLGPYAAIGRSGKQMSHPKDGRGPGVGVSAQLELANVLAGPTSDDTVAQAAFNEVRRVRYRTLTRQQLEVPLPSGIEPMDCCGLARPFTYFDLLFNSTD